MVGDLPLDTCEPLRGLRLALGMFHVENAICPTSSVFATFRLWGAVIGATHQPGRGSPHAGRTQVLAVALLLTDLQENQNRDHAR